MVYVCIKKCGTQKKKCDMQKSAMCKKVRCAKKCDVQKSAMYKKVRCAKKWTQKSGRKKKGKRGKGKKKWTSIKKRGKREKGKMERKMCTQPVFLPSLLLVELSIEGNSTSSFDTKPRHLQKLRIGFYCRFGYAILFERGIY